MTVLQLIFAASRYSPSTSVPLVVLPHFAVLAAVTGTCVWKPICYDLILGSIRRNMTRSCGVGMVILMWPTFSASEKRKKVPEGQVPKNGPSGGKLLSHNRRPESDHDRGFHTYSQTICSAASNMIDGKIWSEIEMYDTMTRMAGRSRQIGSLSYPIAGPLSEPLFSVVERSCPIAEITLLKITVQWIDTFENLKRSKQTKLHLNSQNHAHYWSKRHFSKNESWSNADEKVVDTTGNVIKRWKCWWSIERSKEIADSKLRSP